MTNSPHEPDDEEPERAIPWGEDELRARILHLEVQIEDFAESIERCRKLILASKVAIGIGGILILAMAGGAIKLDALALLGAIAALAGGIVVFGSTRSTSEQQKAALRAAEAERADRIGQIDLTVVENRDAASLPHPG